MKKAFLAIAASIACAVSGFVVGRVTMANQAQKVLDDVKAGYDADIAGMTQYQQSTVTSYEADIEGIKKQLDFYYAGYVEDHSDWQDCCAALKFIDEHVDEIYQVDCSAPIPTVYLKDGRIFKPSEDHVMIEVFRHVPQQSETETTLPVPPTPPTPEAAEIAFLSSLN